MLRNLIRSIFVALFLAVCAGKTMTTISAEGGVQPPVLSQAAASPESGVRVIADGGDPFPPLCPKNPCPVKLPTGN